MVGWIDWTDGRKPAITRVMVQGLPLLRAELPRPRRGGARALKRTVRRGAKLLRREGCRRVLAEPDFAFWPELTQAGLQPVEPEPLLQAMAEPLALAGLQMQAIPAAQATVALRGEWVSQSFLRCAERLCPAVRTLIVSAPKGGEALRGHLWRDFGAPVLEGDTTVRADLALCFSPGWEREREARLALYTGGMDLRGLCVCPREAVLPEGLDPLPALTLLWEEGLLQPEALEIRRMREIPAGERLSTF